MRLFDSPGADTAYDRWMEPSSNDEIEINVVLDIYGLEEECRFADCQVPAMWRVEVKKVQDRSGILIDVCEEHWDRELVFDIYRDLKS